MNSSSTRFTTGTLATALLLGTGAFIGGCGAKSPSVDVQVADSNPSASPSQPAAVREPSGADPAASAEPAMVASHPSSTAAGAQPLPPGHPPLDSAGGAVPAMPMVDPSAGTGSNALAWTPPADWVAETPSSSMRKAQYKVPGPGGDAECAVFYFGPGQGGDPMANAERWASQFTDANGKPAMDTMKTRQETVGKIQVLVVQAHGTYQAGSMMGGPSQARPGSALLAAVAQGPDANWFFKLVGPQATIDAQQAAFEKLLQSLRSGA